MKISYSWLKEYLNIDLDPQDVSAMLTDCGLEVESLERVDQYPGGLSGVFVGEVVHCERHPQADRLHLTRVNIGSDRLLEIVCGAPNVAIGQKVLVATVGSQVQFGAERLTLKPTKIRGAHSEGMICAEDELGLGTSHDGIMVLPVDAEIGTPAATFFNIQSDWVFEIGLTPNRVDAASHIGVARDLSAVLKNKAYLSATPGPNCVLPSVEAFQQDNEALPIKVIVEDHKACPRYSGLTMTGIKVTESPAWLKNRLKAIGLRPINNLVDISNYVLHETGQPLHFFDAAKIDGHTVIVRKAREGQRFVTLDEQERLLSQDDLMICDAQHEMCIAGVFGGIKSGVSEETTSIFIESAYFDPVHIRKSSKRHGLKTDASFRFERGADPEMTLFALKRAALLIKEIAGGTVSSPLYDIYHEPLQAFKVRLKYRTVDTLLGSIISREQIKNILKWLGIEITGQDEDGLSLSVPRFRVDVNREADVVEEILRIYGYNAIPLPERMHTSVAYISHPDEERYRNQISDMLSAQGFNEIMCNSLSHSKYYSLISDWDANQCVPILNPISQELDVMRQTLLFGGLETIAYNKNRKQNDLRLYEFGNVYTLNPVSKEVSDVAPSFEENFHFSMFLTGKRLPEAWNTPAEGVDFFDLKAALQNVFYKLGIQVEMLAETPPSYLRTGMKIVQEGRFIGWMGELDESLVRHFDVQAPVYFANLSWQDVLKMIPVNPVEFRLIPKFPSVRRDLALLVNKGIGFDQIRDIAYSLEPRLLQAVNLFDVYEGKGIGEGEKSYAVSFLLMDNERTMTDKVIDAVMGRLLKAFEEQLGASLRS